MSNIGLYSLSVRVAGLQLYSNVKKVTKNRGV